MAVGLYKLSKKLVGRFQLLFRGIHICSDFANIPREKEQQYPKKNTPNYENRGEDFHLISMGLPRPMARKRITYGKLEVDDSFGVLERL